MEYPVDPDRADRKDGYRKKAAEQFGEAARLAIPNGLFVRECERGRHYQLYPSDLSWLLNFYPENGRIYRDKQHGHAPFLEIFNDEVTLLAVVKAAIEKTVVG